MDIVPGINMDRRSLNRVSTSQPRWSFVKECFKPYLGGTLAAEWPKRPRSLAVLTTVLVALALALGALCAALALRLRDARHTARRLRRGIVKLKDANQVLTTQAHFDPLTGLANRALLSDRFSSCVERARRGQTQFAVAMIDLNRFKAINDTYGHAAGDQVLISVGQRLQAAVRASDTVARLGGDEFVVLIENVADRRELGVLGPKLIEVLSQKVRIESGELIGVGGSVGFGLFPFDGLNLDDLLHVADQGMYECKVSGLMPLV